MVITSIFTYIKSSEIIFDQSKAEMVSTNKRAIETISVMIEKQQAQVQTLSSTKQIMYIMNLKDKTNATAVNQHKSIINEDKNGEILGYVAASVYPESF